MSIHTRKLLGFAALILSMNCYGFSIIVGDNDGYGPENNIPDNGNASWGNTFPGDFRSPSEQTATNGAQGTDLYGVGFINQTGISNFDAVFPFEGRQIQSGVLIIDMGDFQAGAFGTNVVFEVSYNGLLQTGLLEFQDGFRRTRVRQFPLDTMAITNANMDGQFVVNFASTNPHVNDFVAFDFFQLNAELQAVSEPSYLALWSLLVLASLGIVRNGPTARSS